MVDRVLLQPLPYPESENLVMVAHPVPGYGSGEWGLSQAGYFYFKQNSQLLSDFVAFPSPAVVVSDAGLSQESVVAICGPPWSEVTVYPPIGDVCIR